MFGIIRIGRILIVFRYNNSNNNNNDLFSSFSSQMQTTKEVWLVFDGIKMGASITLNGVKLGVAVDQFLRYNFSVTSILKADNILAITFPKQTGIDVDGRFMACSGSADWAPYTNTFDIRGQQTFTKGIWKSVYLVEFDKVAITGIIPQIMYDGEYPLEPIDQDQGNGIKGEFNVSVKAYVYVKPSVTEEFGQFEIQSDWSNSTTIHPIKFPLEGGMQLVHILLPSVKINSRNEKNGVDLWWPNGLGHQKLYNFTIRYSSPSTTVPISTSRQVGFRIFCTC